MARKKIVLVIVEGPSDDTALGIALNRIYDRDFVYVHIMHGDITPRQGVTPVNIVSKIGNDVRDYAKSNHYKAADFKQIIHIVDTDGAYIPDTCIMENLEVEQPRYESDGIYTARVEGIIDRNIRKRENLYRLRTCASIWNIPYRVYYMSCNLDHVLYNKRNSTDEEKETNAYTFARKYRKDRERFVDFICNSSFSANGDFKKSWEHIETDLNSLERYTNLCICIREELESKQE